MANITIPLVGLVDMVIVGHLSSATAIGGIAVGAILFDLLFLGFGFLRMSTSGLTAQAFGAGKFKECGVVLIRSTWIAVLGAMLIWSLQWVYVELVLRLMPCSEEVAVFARAYYHVRIWAAPATLMLMSLKGWLIGMQDGTRAMVSDLVVNITNMIVSYLLAVRSPLGAIGVAWGTLIAQWTGLMVTLVMIALRYRHTLHELDWRKELDVRHYGSRFIRLNADLFVRSLCFIVVYVGWTSLAGAYGDQELAASALMMKLFMFFSYFVDGFAFAGEAIVGKHIGAGDKSGLPRVIRTLLMWGAGVGLFFSLLYGLFPDAIYRLLTSDTEVVDTLGKYTFWLIAMPIVSTWAFMWDGIYAGATLGKEFRNAMLLAAGAFVLTYLATYSHLQMNALYLAYFAHLLARGLYLQLRQKQIFIQ